MLNPYTSLEQQPWDGFPLVGSRLLWKRIFYNPISAHSFFIPRKKECLLYFPKKNQWVWLLVGGRLAKRQGVGVLWRGSSSLMHIQEKHFLSQTCTKNLSFMHAQNSSLMHVKNLPCLCLQGINPFSSFFSYLYISILSFSLMYLYYGENQQEKGVVVLKICYFCLYL